MIVDKRNLFLMRFSSVSHRFVYLFIFHLFPSLLFLCVTVCVCVCVCVCAQSQLACICHTTEKKARRKMSKKKVDMAMRDATKSDENKSALVSDRDGSLLRWQPGMRLCQRTMPVACTKSGLVCDRCKPAVSRQCSCVTGLCHDKCLHQMWFGV